jgi:hypothetical protein
VTRLLFVLMATIGLMLAGCNAPAPQAEQTQSNGGTEKQARAEQADEGPSVEDRPAPEKQERGSGKGSGSKLKANPEPEPAANAASHGSSGRYDATVTVSRAVDGDTIEISPRIAGNEEVRLIGMDTPETKDPSEGIEPYGPVTGVHPKPSPPRPLSSYARSVLPIWAQRIPQMS